MKHFNNKSLLPEVILALPKEEYNDGLSTGDSFTTDEVKVRMGKTNFGIYMISVCATNEMTGEFYKPSHLVIATFGYKSNGMISFHGKLSSRRTIRKRINQLKKLTKFKFTTK